MEGIRNLVETWVSKVDPRRQDLQPEPLPQGRSRGMGKFWLNAKRHRRWEAVDRQNEELLNRMFMLAQGDGWEEVHEKSGIRISRKKVAQQEAMNKSRGTSDAEKFFVVKATATINAPAKKLFELFLDNDRVPEFNEHCRQLRDLEFIGTNTKVSHSVTGRFGGGLFKARDFVTRVHYRTLEDGSYVIVNCPEEHRAAKPSAQYVRAELLLAGNVMRTKRGDPNKTEFMVITHVNPGGIADTKLGSKVVNLLCANAPLKFINCLRDLVSRA